ncbi:hypothetical protein AVEN_250072-1 [Araneus ventricosus]|uniref:SPIN-DOC-like zinc-finger domain-containing protein n=1 Tax=Araneus ventricosus TaxID=182803 RepID=A0A4Y2TZ11_ARAVE|nr:hypothetical protein AVEN_250072-1 [Araneus ventricosus]
MAVTRPSSVSLGVCFHLRESLTASLQMAVTRPSSLRRQHGIWLKKREELKKKTENWLESFAFICNTDGLPTCLICHEKLAHNKKPNLERHFTTNHIQFSGKYPTGDARKKSC